MALSPFVGPFPAAGVPCELHLHARGGYGSGIKPGLRAALADGLARCARWMRANGWPREPRADRTPDHSPQSNDFA